jgi:hypothetical protein
MFRIGFILILSLVLSTLTAVAEFVPTTFMVEDITTTECVPCLDAITGLDILHNYYHNGELISNRYYSLSGTLSNQDVEDRVAYYNATLFPTVIFNGTNTIVGGGGFIANGSAYLNLLNPHRFMASPIKIDITNFNNQTGAVSARVKMISSSYSLNNQSLTFLLMENNVTPSATHVTRAVLTQPISLSGANAYQDFTANLPIQITYNNANLWVAAIVQLDNRAIIQAASNLPQPQFQIRAAMEFSTAIIDSAVYSYNSSPVWFYNYGQANDYTVKLIKDSGPDDWYFNYCSEDGLCFPGYVPSPFSLESGEYVGYHLNLYVGSSGMAYFHFLVESPNMAPYIIPFTYQTSDTPVTDPSMPTPNIKLMQNYPNPFKTSTTFVVNSPKNAQPIQISIYNSKGQKVNSIQTSNLKAGNNEVTWNATDSKGNRLAAGLYFYRVNDNQNSKTHKLIIMN